MAILCASCGTTEQYHVIYQADYPLTSPLKEAISLINNSIDCELFTYPVEGLPPHGDVFVMQREAIGGRAHTIDGTCYIHVSTKMDDKIATAVTVHELLHCLGLEHVTGDPTDVMNDTVGYDWHFGPYMEKVKGRYCSR